MSHRQVFTNLNENKYESALLTLDKLRCNNNNYAVGDTTIPFMEKAIGIKMATVMDSLECIENQSAGTIDSLFSLLRLAKNHLANFKPYGDTITFSIKFAMDSIFLTPLKELLLKNSPESFYAIGNIYFNRKGYSNKMIALAWFKKSSAGGYDKAKNAVNSMKYYSLTNRQKQNYWMTIVDNSLFPEAHNHGTGLLSVGAYNSCIGNSSKGIITGITDYLIGQSGHFGISRGGGTRSKEYFTTYKLVKEQNGIYVYMFFPALYFTTMSQMFGYENKPVIATSNIPLPENRFGGIVGIVKAPIDETPCIEILFGYFSDRKRKDSNGQIPEAYFEDSYSIEKYFSKRMNIK
jgi:hypothetical protein